MAFLASHRAAGHISGECISVDGGMEGRLLWKQNEVRRNRFEATAPPATPLTAKRVSKSPEPRRRRRICVLLSVNVTDLESEPYEDVAFSPQYFVERTAMPRLVRILIKHDILAKTTWFVHGDYLVSQIRDWLAPVARSGAEFAIHGYKNHDDLSQLNRTTRESLLLGRSLDDVKKALGGRKPIGFRTLMEVTSPIVEALHEWGFLYGIYSPYGLND